MSRDFSTRARPETFDQFLLAHGANQFTLERKFGRATVTSTRQIVSGVLEAPINPFPAVAGGFTCRIKAGGDENDTADGSGARQILIQGLDPAGEIQFVPLATNGVDESAFTTEKWFRFLRMWVSSSGTYFESVDGTNVGNIIIETSDLVERLAIAADCGQSQAGVYTVPLGKNATMPRLAINVSGVQAANVFLYHRHNALDFDVPVSAKRLVQAWDGLIGTLEVVWNQHNDHLFDELTDIWFEAAATSATTSVSAEMTLVVR